MEKETAIKKACLKLIERADAAILTTVDNRGFPQTRAMLNLHNKKKYPSLISFLDPQNDFTLFFTTYTRSDKMERIRNNPKVSVYYCDAPIYHGLMLGGEIETITDSGIKKALWQDNWTMYYSGGVDGPEYGVLRLRPSFARGWYQQNAFEFALGNPS